MKKLAYRGFYTAILLWEQLIRDGLNRIAVGSQTCKRSFGHRNIVHLFPVKFHCNFSGLKLSLYSSAFEMIDGVHGYRYFDEYSVPLLENSNDEVWP